MIQYVCQLIIVIFFIIGTLRGLWTDVNGVEARAPYGFSGVVASLVTMGTMIWVYYKAGAFSLLF